MANDSDLYALLGVQKSASSDEIRRAYRKLAHQNHPDLNPNDKAAEERFKTISAAYDVLSDTDKRSRYDEFGPAGLREGFDAEQARAYQRWGGAGAQAAGQDFQGGFHPYGGGGAQEFDLGDIFGDFFGGGASAGAGPGRRRKARGPDIAARVEIDLPQALAGTEIKLQVPTSKTCQACHGAGAEPGSKPEPCSDCHGRGSVQAVNGPMSMRTRCPSCGGKGERARACSACAGTGHAASNDVVTVRIPPGADNGSKLRVAGRGAAGKGGGAPGDLVIEMVVRPHPCFTRSGLDLTLTLPVTLAEAYVGANVEVPTPTGSVSLKVPARSQQGAKMRLRGKGVKRGDQQGDLYVVLDVRLPDSDDPKVAEAVQVIGQAYGSDVREHVRF